MFCATTNKEYIVLLHRYYDVCILANRQWNVHVNVWYAYLPIYVTCYCCTHLWETGVLLVFYFMSLWRT